MQAVSFPARHARAHYRHELRTLTYVTLADGNGGIVRNLNHDGVGVQAVAALRPQERVRLRFELRFPRLRVETDGQVSWASPSGQCGIRFVDLSVRTRRQIDEWIFSNLLDAMAREAAHPRSIFGASVVSIVRQENVRQENVRQENVRQENVHQENARGERVREENVREQNAAEESDGLTLSAAPRPAIRLEPGVAEQSKPSFLHQRSLEDHADSADPYAQVNWLSRPLSGRTLSWLVDSLVVTAALLIFALIFLSIANELPPWPIALGTASVAAVFVGAAYWAVFAVFGRPSLGARLEQAASIAEEDEEGGEAVRIR